MPLTSQHLLQPKGRLNAAALWPKKKTEKVNADLTAYLDEGYVKAADADADAKDEIAAAWSYYRAYQDAYEIRLAMPSTVALNNQGSASTLLTQIEHLGELAAEWKLIFEGLVVVEEGGEVGSYGSIRALR